MIQIVDDGVVFNVLTGDRKRKGRGKEARQGGREEKSRQLASPYMRSNKRTEWALAEVMQLWTWVRDLSSLVCPFRNGHSR